MIYRQQTQTQGAAIITAMLVVVLAVTLVAGLMWQQSLQIRRVENERLRSQATWLLYGGFDWARLIIREDDKASTNGVDHLGEVWSVPVEKTKLSDFIKQYASEEQLKKKKDNLDPADILDSDQETLFSGNIKDAQAKFNLINLITYELKDVNGKMTSVRMINPTGLAMLKRILTASHIENPTLADELAKEIFKARYIDPAALKTSNNEGRANVEKTVSIDGNPNRSFSPSTAASSVSPSTPNNGANTKQSEQLASKNLEEQNNLPIKNLYDLRYMPALQDDALFTKLNERVTILPTSTPININTADANVLIGLFDKASLSQVQQLVEIRNRNYFKDPQLHDLMAQLRNIGLRLPEDIAQKKERYMSIGTRYFNVYGQIDHQEAIVAINGLVMRQQGDMNQVSTQVIWSEPESPLY